MQIFKTVRSPRSQKIFLKSNMYGMKVCVVTVPAQKLPECDLALFGFGWLGEVDYESELAGKTDKLEEAARLSRSCACGVVCGCKTSSRGALRKSAAVADRGKLLGITDMNHVFGGEDYKSGAYLGLYSVGGYKVGLCIENDLFFPEGVRALSACGCNVIAAVCEELRDGMPPLLIRAYAYLYGVPVVLCAGGVAYFAEPAGGIASSNQPVTLFETNPQNSYRLVSSRVRGISEEGRADY